MNRIIVGPFNRVEGDLELTLDIESGFVARAQVATPLYRGFEQILVGRPADDALVIAPRICGICSVSQSMAAAAGLRGLSGIKPARNGELAANLVHAAENIADHLTHFYIFFMPDFARKEYAAEPWFPAIESRFKAMKGSAANPALAARAKLLHIMGLIAGKWPHSLALQPGGVTRALDLGEKMRLIAILAEFRGFLEKDLFSAPLEAVTEITSLTALDAYAETSSGDFAAFLRLGRALGLEQLGRGAQPLLSFGAYASETGFLFGRGLFEAGETRPLPEKSIEEQVAFSFMRDGAADPALAVTEPDADRPGAYSWAKAPRLSGAPTEVGAVARQAVNGDKLIRALLAGKGGTQGGTNVLARVVARVIEIARLTQSAEVWARELRLQDPFCAPAQAPGEGAAVGLVEAARGALGHWLSVERGVISRYQIIAPTTWNFSPRDDKGVAGPLEQALVGVEVGAAGARAPAIQHVVRSFDPCMVCTAH